MTLIVGHANRIDGYRARTAAYKPVVLKPKRCACGKVAFAKQLTQYGKCVACMREEAAAIAAAALIAKVSA